ncbi:MAG: Wzz/FepE/Etk N-terminal domain-containing protein [Candidatus Omnitrophica bacterium]|nr:Wzz/FepE/Etk N-terminal domain-containing protein [Candidatus Omnitrophota bacterium]
MVKGLLQEMKRQLWKKKRLILSGTLLCIIVSVLISLFIPNIYQAKAMLYVLDSQLKTEFIPTEVGVNINQGSSIHQPLSDFRGLIEEWSIAFPALTELGKAPEILKELKDRLDLKDVTLEDLGKKMLKIEILEFTLSFYTKDYAPLIILTAKAKDKKIARDLANTWARILSEKINEITYWKFNETYRFILDELERCKKELLAKENFLKEIEKTSLIPLLEMELKARQDDFLVYNSELNKARLNKKIENTEKEVLLMMLDKTKKEISRLQREIFERKAKFLRIQREIDVMRMGYNLLEQKKEQLKISKVERPQEAKIIVQAVEPQKHIQPRRGLIVLISAVFGFIMVCLWVVIKRD